MKKGLSQKGKRMLSGAFLLLLLAVSGWIGAENAPKTVRTAVTRAETDAVFSGQSAAQRAARQREEALALLDEVLSDSRTPEETAGKALMQKQEIAAAMEKETLCEKTLTALGLDTAWAVCAGDSVSVFVPWQSAAQETERARLLSAICTVLDTEAENIKMLFIKN